MTLSQFMVTLKNRMSIEDSTQTMFLLINNRSLPALSKTLREIYQEFQKEDGYLYLTYSSEKCYG